jgi:hypothetical protein
MTSQRSAPTANRRDAASASVEPEARSLPASGYPPLAGPPTDAPAADPPADNPPADNPPTDDPPADDLPGDDPPASGLERSVRGEHPMRQTGAFPKAAAAPQPQGSLDSAVVDELTRRLPTSELVKIIKGALECGRRNLPFTESDFLRAMTFGSSALPTRQPARGNRTPRG